ncbi:MAG: phage terminase large subunit [Oscillospiraceae bacterium]|nr:phage terminase large subunit [Oscillospiraceae bacterium]
MFYIKLILWGKPNLKQEQFFLSLARHTAYGGARGGGKSWAMRRKFVLLALAYENLKLLLLRRTLTELRENHTLALMAELGDVAKYTERERAFVFPNGSRLKLGYCDSETDVLQYQGQEYDVIGLEEATHFTEYQRNFLTTCNRSTRKDFKPRMYYTSNPGGVGHAWFKRLFIDKRYENGEQPEDFHFIAAKVYDNPALMQNNPEYLQNLKNLPPQMRRAHLDGDWDVYQGQFFPEFSRERHVCKPFEIPSEWERFRSLDYGMDCTACYWWAIDGDRNAYIYREFYEPGLTLSQAAEAIMANSPEAEDIKYTVAGPDLWNARQETATAGVTIMANSGLSGLIPANNNRINGWRIFREYLVQEGKLNIFSLCDNLVRTLPQLQYDKIRIEDAANTPHEVTHAAESVRYGLCSLPLTSRLDDIKTGFWTETEKEDYWRAKGFAIRKNQ